MKKTILIKIISLTLAAAALLALTGFAAGCGGTDSDPYTIRVGASPTPHADILKNVVGDVLADYGYTLDVVEYQDYVLPNTATDNGELDANYFQHKPYLDNFNDERGTHLANVAAVHYEPFGIYPGRVKSLADLPDGATVSVPNDGTNEARALFLLEQEGLITLREGVGYTATRLDIASNPKNLRIEELEAAQLPLSLPDVDLAVINGNYALAANLSVSDALAIEDAAGEPAQTYANVLCVREGREDSPKTKALVTALKSDAVKQYIAKTFGGAVVAL